MNKKENNNSAVNFEFGVDFRYASKEEAKSEATALMEMRLEKMKNLSKDDIIKAKLMQLKFKMETFIKQSVTDNRNYFSEFLESYIDIIYSKRNVFAKDIDITPAKLSQVINNHREPRHEFILKLMVHSDKVYKNICSFNNTLWFQIYFHEKLCDTMSTQKQWRPEIEKQIKVSEFIL